jgi:hypothetical protein
MARKPHKPNRKPSAKPTGSRPRSIPAPQRRAAKPTATEHRVAITSVAVHVRYGGSRSEEFELRGTATLNVGSPESIVRTTATVRLGGKSAKLAYNPASLNRNLAIALPVDDVDLALLREIFVTGTGSELSDPALTVWATTAAPVAPDEASEAEVVEYGYSLDFDPGAALGPR